MCFIDLKIPSSYQRIIIIFISGLITYYMVGFDSDSLKVFYFFLILGVLVFASLSMGHFVSMLSPSLEVSYLFIYF
jgi:hypothetical protein